MEKLFILAMATVLSGCITKATLVSEDRKRYDLHVDQAARKLHANIDGIAYTGTAVGSESVGVGFGQTFGMRPVSGMNTMVMTGNDGQALLTSASGDYIECGYKKSGLTLIGRCQSNKGRQFVLTTD